MNYEITGKIVSVLPETKLNGKNGEIVKNNFVVECPDGQYTAKVCFEVFGAEKWEKMKGSIAVGNQVSVKFSVSSHEWNGKWFNTISAYYVQNLGSNVTQAPQSPLPNAQYADANTQGSQNQDAAPF